MNFDQFKKGYRVRKVHKVGSNTNAGASALTSGVATCQHCGVKGTHIIYYRHKNEPENTVHVDTIAVSKTNVILLTKDHILPKSLGGSNKPSNLRVLCRPCNLKRGNTLNDVEVANIVTHLKDHVDSKQQKEKFERFLKKSHPNMVAEFNMKKNTW